MVPPSADIQVEQAAPVDDWAVQILALMVAAEDLDVLAVQLRALSGALTDDQRQRLHAAVRVLTDARRHGASAEDQALWVGAALAPDAALRDRAVLGAWLGAMRRPEGALAVPDRQALSEWMDSKAEMVPVEWTLRAQADDARWTSDGGGGGELEEPERVRTWTVRIGTRLEDSGEALARRLELRADCRERVIEWATSYSGSAVTYSPGGGALGTGRIGVGMASISVPRSDEVPERPDECIRRSRVAPAVKAYNERLVEELGLAGFALGGGPAVEATRERPVAEAGWLDPGVFEEGEE